MHHLPDALDTRAAPSMYTIFSFSIHRQCEHTKIVNYKTGCSLNTRQDRVLQPLVSYIHELTLLFEDYHRYTQPHLSVVSPTFHLEVLQFSWICLKVTKIMKQIEQLLLYQLSFIYLVLVKIRLQTNNLKDIRDNYVLHLKINERFIRAMDGASLFHPVVPCY